MNTEALRVENAEINSDQNIGSFLLVNKQDEIKHKINFVLSSFDTHGEQGVLDTIIVSDQTDERQAVVGCPYDVGLRYGWTTVESNTVSRNAPHKDDTETFLLQVLPVAQQVLGQLRKVH